MGYVGLNWDLLTRFEKSRFYAPSINYLFPEIVDLIQCPD